MSSPASEVMPTAAPMDNRDVDTTASRTLLFFLVSALLWLAVGGGLMLVHTIQLHTPAYFAAYEFLTFGHVHAAAESALLYGWAGNAAFAMAILVLGRLGGARPRGLGFSLGGGFFWNLGVTVGLGGILAGDASGHSFLQMPAYVMPLLLVAGAAVSTTGILAWSDRRESHAFAAQWYAAAGLFALPWLLSAVILTLSLGSSRGVLPAVVASWAGGNLLTLWLSPVALSVAYYLIPKIDGRPIPYYNLALGAFWTLLLFGAWTGTRVLAGGPFPVWIPTVGIAATIVLLIHYGIVTANLHPIFSSQSTNIAVRFLSLAVAAYALGGLLDVLSSLRSLAVWLQFTYFGDVRLMLLVFGVYSPAVFAACYFFIPRLTGRPWAIVGLVDMHFWTSLLGVILLVGGLAGAGMVQGISLSEPDLSYAALSQSLKPWLLFASGGIGLQLLGAIFLVVNMAYQLVPKCLCSEASKRAAGLGAS